MNASTYLQAPPKRKLLGLAGVVVLHALLFWAVQAGLTRTVIQKMPTVVQALLLEEFKPNSEPPVPATPAQPTPKPQSTLIPPAPRPSQVPPAEIPAAAPSANVITAASTTTQQSTTSSAATTPTVAPAVKSEPVRTGPVGIYCERPSYPLASKRMEEEGSVILNIFVGTDGNVFKINIDKSSGHKRLDEAAKNESMRWRFKPATLDGKPIEHSFTKTFNFKLDPDPIQPSKVDGKSPC